MMNQNKFTKKSLSIQIDESNQKQVKFEDILNDEDENEKYIKKLTTMTFSKLISSSQIKDENMEGVNFHHDEEI